MKIKVFVIIAIIYFFFNSVGLSHGLTYTIILSPIVFIFILPKYIKLFTLYLLVVLFYFVIHSLYGVTNYFEYFKSILLHTSVFILVIGFYNKLKKNPIDVVSAIELLAVLNLIAVFFSLLVIKIPFFSDVIWRDNFLIGSHVQQLRMLVYEPSYYSFLLVPLFFYFFNSVLNRRTLKNVILFCGIILALFLSRSLGVVATIILAVIFTFLRFDFLKKKKNMYWLLIALITSFLSVIFVLIFFPENILVVRIFNFIEGKDLSGSARVFDPWILGIEIISSKSYIFGIGWGQIKILGHDLIYDYYNYYYTHPTARIPNAAGEVFVMFGFLGLFFRLFIQIYLYKVTGVKKSRFRSFLFWFIFIYQFTGSFTSNLVEYVVWVLAFTRIDYFDDNLIPSKKEI